MVVSIEEDQKTLEYQETMNVYGENIANKKQNIWIPIYKVIEKSVFVATKHFLTEFLHRYNNNPDKSQNIPYEVKIVLEKNPVEQGLYSKVVMILRKESENKKGR